MEKIANIIFIYSFLLFQIVLVSNESRFTKKNRTKIVLLLGLIWVIFFSLRDIGLDIEPYKNIFESTQDITLDINYAMGMLDSHIEPFNQILMSTLKHNDLGFSVFLFTMALIPFSIIINIISKTESTPILALHLFSLTLLYQAMDAVRHFVAISVYFWALYFLSNNQVKRFFAKSLLSTLIHYSNVIVIPTYFFMKIKWNLRTYIGCLFCLWLLGEVFSGIIGSNLEHLAENSNLSILFKASYYINNNNLYEYINELHFWLLHIRSYFYFLITVAVNIYILNYGGDKSLKNRFHFFLFKSQLLGTLISSFLIGMGARDFSMRVLFLMSIGIFLLLQDIILIRNNGTTLSSGSKFCLISLVFIIYNFVMLLYLAGIHQPQSPFYLG